MQSIIAAIAVYPHTQTALSMVTERQNVQYQYAGNPEQLAALNFSDVRSDRVGYISVQSGNPSHPRKNVDAAYLKRRDVDDGRR